MIKLIVSDLDGTIINSHNECHPDTIQEITKLKQQGVKFAICTGRPIDSMLSLAENWGLKQISDYIIGSNGGEVLNLLTGKRENNYELSPQLLLEIIDLYEPLGLIPTVYRGRDLYVTKVTEQVKNVAHRVGIDVYCADVRAMITKPEIKEMFVLEPSLMDMVEQFVQQHFDPRYICFKTAHDLLEVNHPSLGKHVGIEVVAKMMQIDMTEILAFGDTSNDVSMLKKVKYGICVANGTEDAKAVAFDIALPMEEQGVAKYLAKHLPTLEYIK